MLKGFDAAAMIPAKDLEGTRRFYEDTLGLSVEEENEGGIRYQSGGTNFWVYPSQFAGTSQATVMGWGVDDIETTIDDLTAKGITFEQYDLPGIKTDAKGIAELGGSRGAWFKDPEGNILALFEPVT